MVKKKYFFVITILLLFLFFNCDLLTIFNEATYFSKLNQADLSSLSVSSGELNPLFSSDITSYSIVVLETETSITITATSKYSDATIKLNNTTIESGKESNPMVLTAGENLIVLEVTASNGRTIRTYSITVFRAYDEQEINIKEGSNSIPNGTVNYGIGSSPIGVPKDIIFTIENNGLKNLNLTGSANKVNISGDSFILKTDAVSPVSSIGSTTFVVTFTPSSAGTRTGTITIDNNDSDENPYTFTINGNGTEQEINIKEGSNSIQNGTINYDIGNSTVGIPQDIIFTIENVGTLDLNLTGSINKVDVTGDSFTLKTDAVSPVSSSSSTTFVVTFTPSSVGTYTATITIDNNDSDENPYTFTILGMCQLNVNLIGTFPASGGQVWDVDVSGDYAYIAYFLSDTSDSGLKIVNISNKSTPFEFGFCNSFILDAGIVLDFNNPTDYVYAADYNNNLRVINVSNKSSPSIAASSPLGGNNGQDVFVSGNYAYVATRFSATLDRLRIINISTPTSPSETGYFDTQGSANGIFVSGNYAFVAADSSGLRIINISTPSSPSETGYYNTPGYAQGVYVLGNFAYIADQYSGLRIINISTPGSPSETGYYDTNNARGVYVSGSYAYVADGNSGLRIIDISSPANPFQVGYYNTTDNARNVVVFEGYIYVADCSGGLVILQAN